MITLDVDVTQTKPLKSRCETQMKTLVSHSIDQLRRISLCGLGKTGQPGTATAMIDHLRDHLKFPNARETSVIWQVSQIGGICRDMSTHNVPRRA